MLEIKGTTQSPYHCSVGLVIIEKDKVLFLQKKDRSFTLPRETIRLDESIKDALSRGAQEELGLIIEIEGFLGSLVSFFIRDRKKIEKTTLYFRCKIIDQTSRSPELDEKDDIILWQDLQVVEKKLSDCNNEEFKVLKRINF